MARARTQESEIPEGLKDEPAVWVATGSDSGYPRLERWTGSDWRGGDSYETCGRVGSTDAQGDGDSLEKCRPEDSGSSAEAHLQGDEVCGLWRWFLIILAMDSERWWYRVKSSEETRRRDCRYNKFKVRSIDDEG
jgi:hypothetical protein